MAFQTIESTDTLPQGRGKINANKDATIAQLNAKAAAGGVRFDGGDATGSSGIDSGTNDFWLAGRVNLADYTPAAQIVLFQSHSAGNNRFALTIEPDGDWRLTFTDNGGIAANYDIAPSLTNATPYTWAVVSDRDGNATLYIDGISVGTPVSIAASSAIDIGSGNVNTYTFSNIEGDLSCGNRALTASEVQTLYEHGGALPAGPEWRWGDVNDIKPTTGVFAEWYGTGSISAATANSFTVTGAVNYAVRNTTKLYSLIKGEKYALNITSTVSGNVYIKGITNVTDSVLFSTGTQTIILTASITNTTGGHLVMSAIDGTGDVTINYMVKTGATTALPMDETAGPVCYDASPNGYDAILSATGWDRIRGGAYRNLAIDTIAIALGNETTDATTGTGVVTFRMPYAMDLDAISASATTAPTGSAAQIDVNASGTSIFSTVLSIDAAEKTSETAATPAVLSRTSLNKDEEISIDIDQIGSTTAGAGYKIYIIGRRK